MESKDWSSCGYFNPNFSPGKPVSLRIWTPLDLDHDPGQMRERICTPGPNPLVDLYSPRSKPARRCTLPVQIR